MNIKMMAKECKRVWNSVRKTGANRKPDWAFKKYEKGCPACEYAHNRTKSKSYCIGGICDFCPLLELWGKVGRGKAPCQDSMSSPYRLYCETNEPFLNKMAASMIVNHLEKKYKV